MKRTYVYYVRYSVYFNGEHLGSGACEYLLPNRIRSIENIDEIIDDIRIQDEIDGDNDIFIDFYKFLRIEKEEDKKEETERKVETEEPEKKTEVDQ